MSLYLGDNLVAGLTIVDKSRNIGQIVQSTIPLTDAGLHLLDGALINGSGIYSAFVDYIADIYDASASYFCSEADWQTSVTTYGSCDKYVYDSVNNTVRIPKRNSEHGDLVQSYSSGTNWYRIYSDGWCEQGSTVATSPTVNPTSISFLKPFINANYTVTATVVNKTDLNVGIGVLAPTYFTAATSLPGSAWALGYVISWQACGYIDISNYQHSPIYEYVVTATSTKTDIQVDIDEVITDLNGKADVDLSNATPAVSFATAMNTAGIRTVVETYVNGTSWYRVWSDGWIEQGGQCAAGNISYIALLKPFTTINYQVHSVGTLTNSTGMSGRNYIAYNKTTVGFNCFMGYSSGGSYVTFWDCANQWYSCGY